MGTGELGIMFGDDDDEKDYEKLLEEIFYGVDSPAAYSGATNLLREARKINKKIDKKVVERWLEKQKAYVFHKDRRLKFKRSSYNVGNIDDLWQTDLIDLQKFSWHNKGYRYIVAVIDCFSKFAWCVPIKKKTSDEIIRAFRLIFAKTARRPVNLQSDKGREFTNKNFRDFLDQHSINFFTANDPATKASICERFIKTIKVLMFKYFTHKNTQVYYDVLDTLVNIYNNRHHRSINMAPSAVNDTNVLEVWRNLRRFADRRTIHPKYSVGDYVLISDTKNVFDKGYKPKWSTELFRVNKVSLHQPVTYRLVDSDNKPIHGIFYEPELQRIDQGSFNDEVLRQIDKLKRIGQSGGSYYYFVKWHGYPDEFNAWVNEDILKK